MTIRYLLLGEGDFTYSLDMCRYFHASLSSSSSSLLFQSSSSSQLHEQAACQHDDSFDKNANPPDNDGERRNSHDRATPSYEITCTGVDTPEELVAKYKDIDFVLQRIRQCRCPDRRLSTVLRHGINAVETAPSSSSSFSSSSPSPSPSPRYHHVIFHHPHLGTEDAARHSRFLHHFFYAAVHRWLVPASKNDKSDEHDELDTDTRQRNKGLVYLTLVTGQCRRWKCLDAAKAQGLVLLRRGAFRPPPPISGGEEEGERKTWYRPRRHQSGKSFAKRRRLRREEDGEGDGEKANEGESESETLVFGRACEWDDSSNAAGRDNVGFFPWELEARNNASSSCKPSHSCRYCDKSFDEARSLKNHLRCCHPNSEEVRAALSERERKRSKHNKKKKTQMQEAHSTNTQPLSETNTHHNHNHHHQNDDEVVDGPPLICNYCNQQRQTTLSPPEQSTGRTTTRTGAHSENQSPTEHETSFPPPRVFPHKQALLDHQRAKHFGDHVDIKPDWCKRNNHNRNEHDNEHDNDSSSMTQSPSHGSCPICHLPFHSEQMKLHHELEFLPSSLPPPPSSSSENGSSSPSNTASSFHACSYCSKPFREVRAKRQHENFCSERPSLGGVEKMITSST